jgi:hypothetical protein
VNHGFTSWHRASTRERVHVAEDRQSQRAVTLDRRRQLGRGRPAGHRASDADARHRGAIGGVDVARLQVQFGQHGLSETELLRRDVGAGDHIGDTDHDDRRGDDDPDRDDLSGGELDDVAGGQSLRETAEERH